MAEYAKELAQLHNWLGFKNKGKSLLPLIKSQSAFIKGAYTKINDYYYKTEDRIPSAEWFLDNYYLINELINELMKDLSKQFESKLKYLAREELAGYPRVYILISEYTKHQENQVDFEQLKEFIHHYQLEAPLLSAEIWAIPIMLKIMILEKIFYQVERILYVQKERERAENWLDSVFGEGKKEIKISDQEIYANTSLSAVYIERVARRLKEHGSDAKILLNWLDNVAAKQNMAIEKVIASEQYYLTSYGVKMGNNIAALKMINSENWSEFFEKVSLVQQILEQDPAQVFNKMDFESRDKYRHEIEFLAGKYNVSELTVAKTLDRLARTAKSPPGDHVGYYLLGSGRMQLEKELTAAWGQVRRSFHGLRCIYRTYPTVSYLGMVLIITLLPFAIFLSYILNLTRTVSLGAAIISTLASLLVFNGIGVYVTNRIFCKILPASFLPKFDYSNGIPENSKTIVVIPAIFSSAQKVKEQLEQLENHYLNNRDENLYFAVLGDFSDAPQEKMDGDDKIIKAGINGIKKLNAKYENKFFYFHRFRKWNEKEKVWMGWERKRGKLIEFNKLLLNEGETSFYIQAGSIESLKDIVYVITLDADTILPKDAAGKLIGTISHPMQKARFNEDLKRVEHGYGIIQPRIGLTAASAFATPFSTMFTGTAGIDPYTCAISDIYQDLFGEGIFTGKGIYDLKVFHAVTMENFPENSILSHDLIEGLYARTGLATDIQLFDGYPTKYLSYTKRLHRWIRGDWQIAPYIFSKELSAISRWKIVDNLRRSLEAPMQLIILFLSLTFLVNVWPLLIGLIVLNLSLPLLLNILGRILNRSLTLRILKYELKVELSRILFSLAVLPYQAYLQTDAIIRSIYRQLISKRGLLEWQTAADAETGVALNPKGFYQKMLPGVIISLLFLLGFYFVNLPAGIVLSALVVVWLVAPYIAYRLSLPYPEEPKEITEKDIIELRKWARQIWAYFDNFVNRENNYLPPDNVQLEPYKGVAPRTSPTNIGLAMLANLGAEDLGYISKYTTLQKVSNSLKTIRKLPKWNGHIYNWYNTATLEPLLPIYISTVDSGNFATYLVALKNGLHEFLKRPVLEAAMLQGLKDTLRLQREENDGQTTEIMDNYSLELDELLNSQQKFSVHSLYHFISPWLNKFTALEKEKGTSFWLTALIKMHRDYAQCLERYFPFLKSSEQLFSAKDLTKFSVRELVRAYLELQRNLDDSASAETKRLIKAGLKHTVLLYLRICRLQRQLERVAYGMDFKPLFDCQKKLFSIGYNLSEQRLDKSYYDLLASEARQSSLFAIAKGDVPESHWFKVSRPLTRIKGHRSLVAWSGTMFEFLMPLILIRNYRGTLLDESYRSVVQIQKAHGQKANSPWGISESGFYSFDIQSNYQYKAFGVPGLGLKRGLSKDMVISPYSTFMALAVDFRESMKNLLLMKELGANGRYGLYEALDFTKSRIPFNKEFSLVKSYMAHHQGMSLISIVNTLNGNVFQTRFHREPAIRSTELLLQEQVPLKEYTFNPIMEEVNEHKIPAVSRKQDEKPTVYFSPDTRIPRANFIAHHDYSVMMTLTGSGYSQYKDIVLNRWREDPTLDMYGTFIYVQNLNSGGVWSATSKPFDYPGEDYKVTCYPNAIKYSRKDGNILTQLFVIVSPQDPVEIRRVTLTNLSQHTRDIQLTSYLEVVLDRLAADTAHPAFSKLFIQTGYEQDTLFAFRRSRIRNDKEYYMMHTFFVDGNLIGDPEYETDRTKFIGRGRSLANPQALDFNQPLTKTTGAVLDPIMSLRGTVRIEPGKTVNVYYLTGIGENKEQVLMLAQKYRNSYILQQTKELSWSQDLMEASNLNLTFAEACLINSLGSHILFPGPSRSKSHIRYNRLGQSGLWAYGISGDYPIVLLKIQENSQHRLVQDMLKVHEYWKIKGLAVDLVILNEDKSGYFQFIQEMIQEKVGFSHARKLVNKPGGVYVLKRDQLSDEVVILLHTVARIIFTGERGSLSNQITKLVRSSEQISLRPEQKREQLSGANENQKNKSSYVELKEELKNNLSYFNGYGGFSKDGKEYVMIIDHENPTPLPWSNIVANPSFGTLVTEAGSGYTWSQNSREYKLTPWSNDPLLDWSGEALYLKDNKTGAVWSPTPQPANDYQPYIVRHGQGYSLFEHSSQGLEQETTIFVPLNHNLKLVRLKLKNQNSEEKNISAYYYTEWVLGVQRGQNAPYLLTEIHDDIVLGRNVYQEEFSGRVAFLGRYGGVFKSYTCDRQDFIGINAGLQEPQGVINARLSEKTGHTPDPCAAMEIGVILKPGEEKTIFFLLGDAEDKGSALALAKSFQNRAKIEESYREVLTYWNELLSTIQVKTPEPTLDLLVNRWLLYQTLACRIWGRAAFYQAGGAFGFRDQLQDVMSFSFLRPEITRKQILLHSSRQFPEGDVQHWWHAEKGKGIRTKFSDDLLWLPYVTADYLEHCGDYSILDEMTSFIDQDCLAEDEDERYTIPAQLDKKASVYEHCVLAIDRSLKFGSHGIPLIGT
ncbi:MAG: glycosyl transferase family 36, partial [Peptococcaceae bacterium]|nr:glycosyl transferase family 36 [Peptococcaceae bacterium]